MKLEEYGWTGRLGTALMKVRRETDLDLDPSRVVSEFRGGFRVVGETGERPAEVSGRLRSCGEDDLFPAVGDWVALRIEDGDERAVIHHVLPRKSRIVRKAAGRTTTAQVVAANLDSVFLVTSMNREFNPRRIERFLAVIWESGANPILVLNKADLCTDAAEFEAEAAQVALGIPIHVVSARTGEGVEALGVHLDPGRTVGLIGSSGVGKSTLLNRLAGEELMDAKEIREDDARGRHTTTSRELFLLSNGAMMIDTPGLREVALWAGEEGLSEVFADLEALAAECRFSDCRHEAEPGCAVREAMEDGTLDPGRLQSYRKLLRELAHVRRMQSHRERLNTKRRWKQITKWYRKRKKTQWGRG